MRRKKKKETKFRSNRIFIDLISDCAYSGKNGKNHGHLRTHAANNNTTNANNNNNNSNNNNQKPKREFSIGEDATITEDDLDNLINQSITEWQQRQKSNSDDN